MSPTSDNAVVITGAGCVLPGCNTTEEFWGRLLTADSAITPYRDAHIDSSLIPCFGAISQEQRAMASEAVPFKLRRYSAPTAQWAVKAAREALAQAGLDLQQVPEDRRGLFTAQGDFTFPSTPSFARGIAGAQEKRSLDLVTLTNECMHLRGVDPFMAIKCLANNVLAIASLSFEMRGDAAAFVQDDSAIPAALRSAVFSLQQGYSDMALLLFAGSYNEALTLAELYRLEYLSACNDGAASLRPFDLRRDGTIPGEGAIALVLETASHARRRHALPLAQVRGIGNAIDAPARPAGVDAYQRCVRPALAAAGLGLDDIDVIVASGKGSYQHDHREAARLVALQDSIAMLPVTCATAITGTVPACPTQWLAALGILQTGVVPHVAHLEQSLEPRLDLVRDVPRQTPSRHVLALDAGFAGSHSAVLFSHSLA
ncbi:MAG TPA: beta-ketoacyl synthase N-terminal-like domain-containing protein [Noviherbaspirillum sp.]